MRRPLVCSNLSDRYGRTLPFVSEVSFESAGVAVRVFSLLVVQYPPGSPWERMFGWSFRDPIAIAREHAARARDGEVLIVLSHLGLRSDRELARAVPRLDLVLGGHSHDTLHAPEFAGNVPIVHAGPYGRFVSRTELDVGSGRATLAEFALLPLLPAA